MIFFLSGQRLPVREKTPKTRGKEPKTTAILPDGTANWPSASSSSLRRKTRYVAHHVPRHPGKPLVLACFSCNKPQKN